MAFNPYQIVTAAEGKSIDEATSYLASKIHAIYPSGSSGEKWTLQGGVSIAVVVNGG